ncbi:MAG TPA: hypothetical protein DCY79_09670 [Planctomycetaceae bacterium]|nr:hypothetical protein [Blastopirellula sp.]HAY80057.1 hypothetical protein [Planctomycetaceae bacterium]
MNRAAFSIRIQNHACAGNLGLGPRGLGHDRVVAKHHGIPSDSAMQDAMLVSARFLGKRSRAGW